MHLWELFEAVRPMEVYHWASTESLERILWSGMIQTGASTHDLNGKTLHGVSLTRNAFFDISHTYAVSGRRPWRIGLDYQKLRQRFKVIPIRDEYLRKHARGKRVKQKAMYGMHVMASSDEQEEFCLSDIPLDGYVTSIAVEDRWADMTVHPMEVADDPDYYEQEYELESDDLKLLWSILSHTNPDLLHAFLSKRSSKKYQTWTPAHIQYPETPRGEPVPFYALDREGHRLYPFAERWSFISS